MERNPHILENETLDELRLGGMKILQRKDGYRFSLDPILLCAFAKIKPGDRVLDLGTGSGIIPLILGRVTQAARVIGVEIQPEMADRARRSVLLNELQDRVEIVCGDLRGENPLQGFSPFSVVVSNPPYRRPGTGRHAPDNERALARHELAGGIDDFVRVASERLEEGGRFFMVHLAERLVDLVAVMRLLRLEPKRLRFVHSRAGEAARLLLVEGRKGGRPGLEVEAPLYVYEGDRYSQEVLEIYGEEDPGGVL